MDSRLEVPFDTSPGQNRGMYWVIGEDNPRYLVPRSHREHQGYNMYDRRRDEHNRASRIQGLVRGRQARSTRPRGRIERQREAIRLGYGGPLDTRYRDASPDSWWRSLNHVDRMDRDEYMQYYDVPYWNRHGI